MPAIIGAPTTRAHFPAFAERNLRHWYLLSYTGKGEPEIYPDLYSMDTTEIQIEREAVAAGLGTFSSKAEGASIDYDSGQQFNTQTYTPVTYVKGVQVTREAVEDDIHGVVKQLATTGSALARVAKYTKERDAMAVFNSYLTSGTLFSVSGTGYSLLSASHVIADGTTWTNTPGGTPDLSYEAVEFAMAHWMANMVDVRGLKSTMMPSVLLHGIDNWGIAARIFGTRDHMPGSANNDINAVTSRYGNLRPICHKLLTNDGRWLMLAPHDSEYGLRYYDRVKPGIEKWPNTDNGDYRFVGRYRCVSGGTHAFGTWGVS